ncbi:MAG: glycoside hydrolase family 19 protein [Alphaproteobacteria bacterium]|nr:glycoside hydrolase family 19 protein [Alphaproteobacteria bacterium]
MLTIDLIRTAIPKATKANIERFAQPLIDACAQFGIDTPMRQAAFLAQVAHESGHLAHVVENLNYSAAGLASVFPKKFPTKEIQAAYARRPEAIANRAYANRLGNGDEDSGDGNRFKGRGLIQITGRENYRSCGQALGLDLLAGPQLLEVPIVAAQSAGWFWDLRALNRVADSGDVAAVTRRVNGGSNGLADRQANYALALAVLTGAELPA